MYLKMECSFLFFLCFGVLTIFSKVIATSPRGSSSLDSQNQFCTTSNNVPGICVSIFQCKQLFDVYKRTWGPEASDEDKQFLQNAYCGSRRPLDQRVCCEKATVSHQTLLERPNRRCGESPFKKINEKVFHGKNSDLGAWPWMAAIYHTNSSTNASRFMCGGSLIASDWVLTAAHCIPTNPDLRLDHVLLGDLDINPSVDDEANPIEMKVKKVIKHPKYNPWLMELNDIALLQLEEPVIFFDYISPICLHKDKKYAGNSKIYGQKQALVVGWGDIFSRKKRITHLQEASLNTLSSEQCHRDYPKGNKSVLCCYSSKMCASKGDSGGPLMFLEEGSVWSQGGIISFGTCTEKRSLSGHTKVAAFIDWIEKETRLKF